MSGDERITDPATIRTYWEDDEEVTRIARRVGAALNSGRDAAVVQVVLDETETLRAKVQAVEALADLFDSIADNYEAGSLKYPTNSVTARSVAARIRAVMVAS